MRIRLVITLITFVALLGPALTGCTERTELAPVWSGYQNLNDSAVPQTAVRARPETFSPPMPYPQARPPRPLSRPVSVPKTVPQPAKRLTQKPAPVAGLLPRPSANERTLAPKSGTPTPDVNRTAASDPAPTEKPVRKNPAKSLKPPATVALKDSADLSFGWPLGGKILRNFKQTGKKGIKISGKKGQPVLAAEDGKVVYSGQGLIGYGNLLIIKHNDQYLTAYANNNALLSREGDLVKKGQKIATVGVGAARKPLLHFEIRKQGKPVNPLTLLPSL